MSDSPMTFWQHLDVLRKVIVQTLATVLVIAIVAFFFKEILFDVVLAPSKSDFFTYRLLGYLSEMLQIPAMRPDDFHIELINTQLTSQFMTHMSVSFYAALLLTMPLVLYKLYHFVSPALYNAERHYTVQVLVWSYLLFIFGVLLNYFVIFPLSFRFLGNYQVSEEVQNLISLTSYIDTLLVLTLLMGILFEIPILSWLLAKLGFLSADRMRRYRRHALVVILIVAAIITPTADIFTLMAVSAPIYLLYEASIVIVKRTTKEKP